jgi:tyrosine-protein phosphatase SIW14
MRLRSRVLGLLVVTFGAAWPPTVAQTPAQPAQTERPYSSQSAVRTTARRMQRPGLPRLGMITSYLFRGGQPEDRGFAELQALGVDLVVNLRNEADEIVRERALVEAQGMRYVSIPWRGKENPKPEQVVEFLDLLRANVDKIVFVHCERGSERTGVMIACYRMSSEGWTAEQALTEMEAFGFRRFGFGHLKRFVREFPSLMSREPFVARAERGARPSR